MVHCSCRYAHACLICAGQVIVYRRRPPCHKRAWRGVQPLAFPRRTKTLSPRCVILTVRNQSSLLLIWRAFHVVITLTDLQSPPTCRHAVDMLLLPVTTDTEACVTHPTAGRADVVVAILDLQTAQVADGEEKISYVLVIYASDPPGHAPHSLRAMIAARFLPWFLL